MSARSGGLYRERWQTFEDYCEQRWELDIRHAERLMAAAAFAENATNWSLPLPSRESHFRPLTRLNTDDDRLAVWRSVLEASGPRFSIAGSGRA